MIALARAFLAIFFYAEHETVTPPPTDIDKWHQAAELDDLNRDWQLLGYVTTDSHLRRVLYAQTADVPFADAVPWHDLTTRPVR